jgi:hypothetical protein
VEIAMFVLTGFLIGGVISFARTKHWVIAIVLGTAALLSLASALAWARR